MEANLRGLGLVLILCTLVDPIGESAHAEPRVRRREHVAPPGSLGGFLRAGPEAAPYRPSFERGMADLAPTVPPPVADEEEAAERAEQGWDALRRQFESAPSDDPRLRASYSRGRIVVFSPCQSRAEVEGEPESLRFATTAGMALVLGDRAGSLQADVVETPALVTAALEPGPGRRAAWDRFRREFVQGTARIGGLPHAPSPQVAFGPVLRRLREGLSETAMETHVTLRGTATDQVAQVTVIERRTNPKTGRISLKRTETYCR